jgi:glycine betaine catabolism B
MITVLRKADNLLNNITMYRLVAYGLGALLLVAAGLGQLGYMSVKPLGLLTAAGMLIAVCWLTNKVLAYVWRTAANSESWLITALILTCILPPVTTARQALGVAAAGIIAMASKYLLALNRKHIFNPAAFAAAAVGLLGVLHATWWIAAPPLLPFTALLGLLVVRKVRQFQVAIVFGMVAGLVMLAVGKHHGYESSYIVKQALTSWPLVFFGSIMLTEPATMPPVRNWRLVYGALAGVLFASQLRVGPVATTPEISLLLANLFSYVVSPRYNLLLTLKSRHELSPGTYDFVFEPDRQPTFKPGQYLEWTLPHTKVDSRGNRRTFTIASSPTEPNVRLGVRFAERSSSFKQALLSLRPGDTLMAGHLAGNFTLPDDTDAKLVFIAGGIGITPFRSMLKYVVDTKQQRDIILFYVVRGSGDICYRDVLMKAEQQGVQVIVLGPGMLTRKLIEEKAPDYQGRTFYLSGANVRVDEYRRLLTEMRVPSHRIIADHFSGY